MEMLQGVGVPAGAVNSCENLFSDKQLAHRGHYVWMDHPEMGQHPFDGTEFICSATPALYKTPSPMLGQHNEYVLKEVLRMTDDEIGDSGGLGGAVLGVLTAQARRPLDPTLPRTYDYPRR